MAVAPASGQAVDSTNTVVSDSVRSESMTLDRKDRGADRLIASRIPRLRDVLGRRPGTFVFRFGESGWPDGVAPFGLNPDRTRLELFDVPLENLTTGAPAFDDAPESWVGQVDGSFGDWSLEVPRFDSDRPLTDIRYASHGGGGQSAHVLHVQNRSFVREMDSVTVRTTRLQTAFAYHGAAASADYPGSRLKRQRRLSVRLRMERNDWSVELFEMHNRRHIGAHGGVEPIPGAGYESIHQRLGATVSDEDDERQTIRNDLFLRGSGRLLGRPTQATLFWSVDTFSFNSPGDSTTSRIMRLGGVLSQEWDRISLRARAWRDQPWGADFGDVVEDDHVDVRLGTTGMASGIGYRVDAGIARDAGRTLPSVGIRLETNQTMRLGFESHYQGSPRPWVDRVGFGARASAVSHSNTWRIWRNALSAGWSGSGWDIRATAFGIRERDVVLRWQEPDGTISTSVMDGSATTFGFTARIAWSWAERGPYASLEPTVRTARTPDHALANAWSRSVPDVWVDGRIGWRALLFQEDLDLDLSIRGTWWDAFGGRRLHTATGLLVLPQDPDERVPTSGTIDLVAEAGIRTATLFVSWENVLAGTGVLVGNLIVPDYPLPAQRIRFGVFWPILD